MDSTIMTDKEDESLMTSTPPTRIITVKNQYTVKDQDEMLSLAQQKFDFMIRRNRERARSSRYQRLSRGGNNRLSKPNPEKTKIHQLLSSLLYLSLMMHKVDEMKKILEHRDLNLYNEWNVLLQQLHSPVFHMKERRIQNARVKKIFKRKDKYKNDYEETKSFLVKSQDTLKELSQAMAKLTEDNKKTHDILNEKRNVEVDLASARKESEIRQNQLLAKEDEINNFKSDCSQLHSTIESLQNEQGKLLNSIQTYKTNSEDATKEIAKFRDDLDAKMKQIKELECQSMALQKDLDALSIQLTLEQSSHASTKESQETQLIESKAQWKETHSLLKTTQDTLTQFELKKSEEVSNLQKDMTNAMNHSKVKSTELDRTQEELSKIRMDLDTKAKALSDTLELIKAERDISKSLEEKQSSAMKDMISLSVSLEKAKAENLLLAQTMARLEGDLKRKIIETDERVSKFEEELKVKNAKLVEAEKEVVILTCTNTSLEKSLSEAVKLKTCAEEQKQKLIDGETNSVNLSIEKLTEENLQITKMMGSMKDNLMQDVHNALEEQKLAEQKAISLQKQLIQTEKETAILKCTNVSLEKSLSEAVQLKTSAEEQNQKLIDGETNSVNLSIEKLAEENLRINKVMGSMKDSLLQDVHNALEQQKLAELKADSLQKQLIQTEKEVTILKCTNISLEKSLSDAVQLKTSAEAQKQKLIDVEANSLNSSIKKLSSDNLRLTEMMGSMKESLIKDVRNALEQQKSTEQEATKTCKDTDTDGIGSKISNPGNVPGVVDYKNKSNERIGHKVNDEHIDPDEDNVIQPSEKDEIDSNDIGTNDVATNESSVENSQNVADISNISEAKRDRKVNDEYLTIDKDYVGKSSEENEMNNSKMIEVVEDESNYNATNDNEAATSSQETIVGKEAEKVVNKAMERAIDKVTSA
jgi:hypothetical protein